MELRVANWDQNTRILKCYNNQHFFSILCTHKIFIITWFWDCLSALLKWFCHESSYFSTTCFYGFQEVTSDRDEPFRCWQGGQACWLAIQYARLTTSLNQEESYLAFIFNFHFYNGNPFICKVDQEIWGYSSKKFRNTPKYIYLLKKKVSYFQI